MGTRTLSKTEALAEIRAKNDTGGHIQTVINLDAFKARLLKLVGRACNKNAARPVLCGVKVEEGHMVAADGFRMHAVKIEAGTFPQGIQGIKLLDKIPTKGDYILYDLENGHTFPDVVQIMPVRQPVFEIAVNAQFLVDFCADCADYVTLRFYGETYPIEIFGTVENPEGEDVSTYALVMPTKSNGRELWRPYSPARYVKNAENGAK